MYVPIMWPVLGCVFSFHVPCVFIWSSSCVWLVYSPGLSYFVACHAWNLSSHDIYLSVKWLVLPCYHLSCPVTRLSCSLDCSCVLHALSSYTTFLATWPICHVRETCFSIAFYYILKLISSIIKLTFSVVIPLTELHPARGDISDLKWAKREI